MSDNIKRIDAPDDPHRCQAITSYGQCQCKAVEGGTMCHIHGGGNQLKAQREEAKRNYYLGQWQNKLEQKLVSPDLKSLRDEIGILRMMLEARLNQCKTDTDLMLHSSAVSDLVMKIEKVVQSCHKLEARMGIMLDRQTILNFASQVIQIVATTLQGEDDKIEQISNRILVEIGNLGEEKSDEEPQ